MTKREAKDALEAWDSAVTINRIRERALGDSSYSTEEYVKLFNATVWASFKARLALSDELDFCGPIGVANGN